MTRIFEATAGCVRSCGHAITVPQHPLLVHFLLGIHRGPPPEHRVYLPPLQGFPRLAHRARCLRRQLQSLLHVGKNWRTAHLDLLAENTLVYWVAVISAKNHKRQRRNRQTRKVANAKGLNRNTNLTSPNLTSPNLT